MIEGNASQVLKVNPATASIEKTTHRSIYFSPTGDYYYGPASFGPQENVYARAMDFPLKNTSRVLSSFNGFRPMAWAPDADLLLVEASRGAGRAAEQVMVIYDPKADTSLDVPLTVVGWGPTSHELVRMSDDSVRLSAVSDFGSFR